MKFFLLVIANLKQRSAERSGAKGEAIYFKN
jgi:hypothetical protein